MALRHKCAEHRWSVKEVARQVQAVRLGGVKGAQHQHDGNAFAVEQLQLWLRTAGLSYTESGLAFLVHMAGADLRQCIEQKKKINSARFVYGVDRVAPTPILF